MSELNTLTLQVTGSTGSQEVNSILRDALHKLFKSLALGYFFKSSSFALLHCHNALTQVLEKELNQKSSWTLKWETYHSSGPPVAARTSLYPGKNSKPSNWHLHCPIGIHSPLSSKAWPSGQLHPSAHWTLHSGSTAMSKQVLVQELPQTWYFCPPGQWIPHSLISALQSIFMPFREHSVA